MGTSSKYGKYFLAILACFGFVIVYFSILSIIFNIISDALGRKSLFPMGPLFIPYLIMSLIGILGVRYFWKAFTSQDNNDKNEENNELLEDKAEKLFSLGQFKEAVKTYDKIITIKPSEVNVWHYKGLAHISLGQYENARKALEEAIKLNPTDAEAWLHKGLALINMGRYEEALKSYERAIVINSELVEAWEKKAFCHKELGQYKEADKADEAVNKLNSGK